MTRPLFIALCAVALLAALGVWAQSFISTPEVAAVAPTAKPPVETPSLDESPVETQLTATVLEAGDDAERYEPKTQAWTPLQTGSSLEESTLLRTHKGSIRITIGVATEVEVSADSKFRLDEMKESGSKVSLEEGRVSARIRNGSGSRLAVGVRGSDSEVVSEGGQFSILRSANADVTVASQKGTLTVSGQDTSVHLKAGEQSVTPVGQPPAPAVKIPGSLFVKLNLAGKQRLRTRHTIVQGSATPGSVVSVNGVNAAAVNGKFSVRVPLTEGNNSVQVIARDALGRTHTDRVSGLVVDSTPPKIRGKVQW